MEVPKRANWFEKAPPDGDDLGNNSYGCCVPAADFREIELRRRVAHGDAWRPTRETVLARYAAIAGWRQDDPTTDQGTVTTTDMADRCSRGIRINDQDLDVVRWATVHPANDADISLAIAHLGSLLITLALPLALQDLSLWSKAPGDGPDWVAGSWGAHRVMVGAFDGPERVCRTWGLDLTLHPTSWARYCIACDATISRMWLDATGLSPSGLDWDALQEDLQDLAT